MDHESKLEQYVLLAKGLRGLALCDLINKATAEPGLFIFGELLCLPAVQELHGGEHAAALSLLQLFAYGTWPDYAADPSRFPPLSDAQQRKLRLLTVASLASGRRTLPYAELRAALGVEGARRMEEVLIADCIYGGLLRGRLDQRGQCLHVEDALPRDISPARLPLVVAELDEWLASARGVLGAIQGRMDWAAAAGRAAAAQRAALEAEEEAERRSVRAALEVQAQQDVGAMALDDAADIFLPPGLGGDDDPGRAGGSRIKRRR